MLLAAILTPTPDIANMMVLRGADDLPLFSERGHRLAFWKTATQTQGSRRNGGSILKSSNLRWDFHEIGSLTCSLPSRKFCIQANCLWQPEARAAHQKIASAFRCKE